MISSDATPLAKAVSVSLLVHLIPGGLPWRAKCESKCNVLTRFDAFVLIVADIGGPTHGHTDGYDGLGLGLNRYVKICMCYRSNSVYTRPGSAYIYAFIYKAQA